MQPSWCSFLCYWSIRHYWCSWSSGLTWPLSRCIVFHQPVFVRVCARARVCVALNAPCHVHFYGLFDNKVRHVALPVSPDSSSGSPRKRSRVFQTSSTTRALAATSSCHVSQRDPPEQRHRLVFVLTLLMLVIGYMTAWRTACSVNAYLCCHSFIPRSSHSAHWR